MTKSIFENRLAKYGSDYLLPLARIFWENEPVEISDYIQKQSFYDGTIKTSFKTNGKDINVETWFDAVQKDLAGITITGDVKGSKIVFALCVKLNVHYNQVINQEIEIKNVDDQWEIRISAMGKSTYLYLKTNAEVRVEGKTLRLILMEGRNSISAKYCFQNAIRYGLDSDGAYSRILNEGLAFPALLSERGYYYSCAGSGEEDFGEQKHPVQLNALTYLPVNGQAENASKIAYDLRYDITSDPNQPYFYGWSLGTFLLAGSRMGNVV